MNKTYTLHDCQITLNKQGSKEHLRMSFPIHCGVYTVVETNSFIFHFSPSGEILRAKGKNLDWAHPHEWLKRSKGNDWIYYSTGGYTGVLEATGEYYLPNFTYPTNNLLGGKPFAQKEIQRVATSWHSELKQINNNNTLPDKAQLFVNSAITNSPEYLQEKAHTLFAITKGRVSVLPPDARHVDYDIIPINISTGCLYKCRFCKVKNLTPFTEKTKPEIDHQIQQLRNLYGKDLQNYNSIFLGEHDSLNCSPKTICDTIEKAHQEFDFPQSYMTGCNGFLFGSVTSFLNTPEQLFRDLEQLPGSFYINLGLESGDQATLEKLGKPITAKMVTEAFTRMQEINNNFSTIEITANFLLDENLPENHYVATTKLIRDRLHHKKPKGTIYFSPLTFDKPSRKRLFEFNRLKILSKLPTYLYIIQRL